MESYIDGIGTDELDSNERNTNELDTNELRIRSRHPPRPASARPASARSPRPAAPATSPLPPGYQLHFFAPFCYSPRGVSEVARHSRWLRDLVKQADAGTLTRAIRVLVAIRESGIAATFIAPASTLIPVPCRAPRPVGARPSPAEAICFALQAAHFGKAVWPALRRRHPIAKSAWSRPSSRPEFRDHYDSLELTDRKPPTTSLVLVDDIVTRGRTLLASAAALRHHLPNADIRAFALLRTRGIEPDIEALADPVIGTIRYLGGDAFRFP